MTAKETKNWTFHHVGVIVQDLDKAVEYYKSLGFIDFPAEIEKKDNRPLWEKITAYGQTVIEKGQPLFHVKPGLKPGRVKFCRMGTIPLELIEPGDAFQEVNGDFLKSRGEGIDHIAYTVPATHFAREMEKMESKGLSILFSGRQFNGGGFAYFDTRKVGGIITELMRVPE